MTYDHQFMTYEGWKRLEELEIDKTFVAVSLEPKSVPIDVEEYLILDEEIFTVNFLNTGRTEYSLIKYISELQHLFPLKSNSIYLPVLSRMFGFILTDGHTSKHSTYFGVYFGHEYSSELFEQDVKFLGFEPRKAKYVTNNGDRYGNTYNVNYNGSLAALFIALGMTCGKKTTQPSKEIPHWIMNGSDMVKREFLAGFQGGDGSKIKSSNEKQINIQIGNSIHN